MKPTFDAYLRIVDKYTPKSQMAKGCIRAYWVGGAICAFAQILQTIFENYVTHDSESAGAIVIIIMIFLGATLTGLGVYDRIGKYAGGGSIVPITGFANSIVAPAMEFRREGLVLGVGAKMFAIAGPVLVYGIGVSIIIGVLHFLMGG